MQAFWTNIIGLSRRECNCSSTNRPGDYDVSKSGYFITDLEPLNDLKAIEDCEFGNVWDILTDARTKAINEVRTDIQNGIIQGKKWKFSRRIFQGEIGMEWYDDDLSLSYSYAGIRITCLNVPGGTIKIKGIKTVFKETGPLTLQIYDNQNNKIDDDIPVETLADDAKANAVDIELPMLPKGNRLAEYYLVYQTTGHIPKNCIIGNIREYRDWLSISGIQNNDTDFYCTSAIQSSCINGLIVDIETVCDPFLSVARDDVDFDSDALAKTVARAVNFKAAELIGRLFLAADPVNRKALIDDKRMWDYVMFWGSNYSDNIKYITDNIDPLASGCYECFNKDKLKIRGILS